MVLTTWEKVGFWTAGFYLVTVLASLGQSRDLVASAIFGGLAAAVVVYLGGKHRGAWQPRPPQTIVVQAVQAPAPVVPAPLPALRVAGGYEANKAHLLNDCCANCVNRSVCYATQKKLAENWDYHCPEYGRDAALALEAGPKVDLGRK